MAGEENTTDGYDFADSRGAWTSPIVELEAPFACRGIANEYAMEGVLTVRV